MIEKSPYIQNSILANLDLSFWPCTVRAIISPRLGGIMPFNRKRSDTTNGNGSGISSGGGSGGSGISSGGSGISSSGSGIGGSSSNTTE